MKGWCEDGETILGSLRLLQGVIPVASPTGGEVIMGPISTSIVPQDHTVKNAIQHHVQVFAGRPP